MRRPKKYQSGEGSQYITRKQALKKLQLTLNDFRRLCIIKGIYPREPKHRRRAQKGSTDIRILYHTKDIRFLLHEPIVWTLRDYKIFAKKSGRDRAIRDFRNLKRRLSQYPELKIDHVVKERYPTFIDAIKDLDDCLTLLFLFSTFPSLHLISREQSALCRRLTLEFLHYIMASKALRKVFISIKGYYFQADIKGHKVTWIMPHYYPFKPHFKAEVDFKVMSIFVEFYTIMLGFVNFRLYHSINMTYPPQLAMSALQEVEEYRQSEESFVSSRIASLATDLLKSKVDVREQEVDEIDLELLQQDGNSEKIIKMKQEAANIKKLKNLFCGLKFFISREVPREPLVLIIKSFGGQVSWDKNIHLGATFVETDETITHQVVDRTNLGKQYISRDYIQPQWIFDCVNQKSLLPTNKYFIGAVLPPHLSPFVEPNNDTHIPPEENQLDNSICEKFGEDSRNENDEDLNEQLERVYEEEEEERQEFEDIGDNSRRCNNEDITDKDTKRTQEKRNMLVKTGQVYKDNNRVQRKIKVEEHRLQARMIKPRHRNLFRKLIREKQTKDKELWLLKKKRRLLEESKKQMDIKKQKK